jgi:hypothetical protein
MVRTLENSRSPQRSVHQKNEAINSNDLQVSKEEIAQFIHTSPQKLHKQNNS